MYSSIMVHLDQHKILSEFQHGFRKQRSCETQLLLTIHDFTTSLEAGEQLDAVVLHFSKAFDKVPHKRLCMNLSIMEYVDLLYFGWRISLVTGLNK